MGLFLSLLRLNPMSREVNRDITDVSDMHRTIMQAFPVADPENNARALYGVLHRLEINRKAGTASLYVQSSVPPTWEALPADYMLANTSNSVAVRSIQSAYAGVTTGRRLRFRLRANATRKIDTKTGPDGRRRHGRRVPVRGEAEQMKWLERQGMQHGFGLVAATVTASGAPELVRSRRPQRTFQGVLYEGILIVEDVALFQRALATGIGPGKAFGFGLVSIASE